MSLDPAALAITFVVSSIGFVLTYYGKKQSRLPHMVTGLGLMVFPLFVSNVLVCVGVAAGLLAGLWFAVRAGW
jgi:hypothetical protein